MNVLEVRNATKRFGSLVAVQDVSLSVPKGELRAIIGPNGAGKTTFFNLISGFLAPSAGTIEFDGRDITLMPAHERVALGMARTFQITEIFPELTVFENVRVGTEVTAGYCLRPWISRAQQNDIHSRVEEWRGKVFIQSHRIMRGETLICEGRATRALCVKQADGRLKAVPVPDFIRAACE